MVSYDFYQNTYLGSALSEVAFKQAAARAESFLSMLERKCYVAPCGEDSRAMAVCAVAEVLAENHRQSGIKSQSIGGVSVTYMDDADSKLHRKLLQAASVYLDICRGVDE
jgi:hypothetical protein